MKICLVTAFPPSKERLNEYGYHLARELQSQSGISVTVLADQYPGEPAPELEGFSVDRCWRFNDLLTPFKLVRALRRYKPDVVWFNLVFSSFGDKPIPAFIGLCTPLIARLCGVYSHVTLHHILETIDLSKGTKFPKLYAFAGWFATKLLLAANFVSVLLPSYRKTLLKKYRGHNVQLRRHGIFGAKPQIPDFERRAGKTFRILAFGKWGTYKRLELLIEAFQMVLRKYPDTKLVIAGSSHPLTPGYVESVREKYSSSPNFEFHGYVEEDDIPALFSGSNVLVLPYDSAGGPSGVAHQACEFGLPIVSSDLPDFRDMAEDGEIAISFYENRSAQALAKALCELIENPEHERKMAEQNFHAGLQMNMSHIVKTYVQSFARWQYGEDLRKGGRSFHRPAIQDMAKSGARELGMKSGAA